MYIAPEQCRNNPWVHFFKIINIQSICQITVSFALLMTFLQFPPFKCYCRKIGQGHHRVMIYINFIELHLLVLYAKFQNHRPSGSEEEEEDFYSCFFFLFIAMVAILVM